MLKLIFITATLFLVGCSSSSSLSELRAKEELMITAENYAGLVDIYTDILKNEDTIENREILAKYFFLLEDYESSVFHLENVIERDNVNPDTYYNQSINYYMLGENVTALKLIDSSISLKEDNAKYYNHKGIILSRMVKYDQSIEAFNKSRELLYDNKKIKNNLALVHLKKGDYTRALSILMPVYLMDSNDKKTVANMIVIMAKLHDRDFVYNLLRNKYDMDNSEAVFIYDSLSNPNFI
ncbi:tetratricopeptide repeat protein [Vibrio hepatarius]|uniref:tetratricopeptide repeat protein n=1 Tax=Vibrio hepatarius TaxID=171383 RepID=UPI001C07FA81|nr:hypothetical protein [Vibrio hepatarius]MBU2896210.1 hypothetical protein [Vibrio hepatarius]